MSKLAKALHVVELQERHAEVPPMRYVSVEGGITQIPILASIKVEVRASFIATAFVPEGDLKSRRMPLTSETLRDVRKRIVEEVFGEFRPRIYDIHEAVANRDWVEAAALLNQLHTEMFDVD